jgi:hypothetical protein
VEKVVERLHPNPGAPIPEIARPEQVDQTARARNLSCAGAEVCPDSPQDLPRRPDLRAA